jgi:molybdopterin synthase sulfur carrier subunit
MSVKLVYFAWVRERIGKDHEEVDLPDSIETVRDLLDWLKARGDGYAAALAHPQAIRVALDMEHVQHGEKIGTPYEIALFPPMTGG